MSKIFKKNIYYLVTLVIFLGLAIPFFFITILEFKQFESAAMKDAHESISHTTKIMARGLSRALWEYSVENVEPIVDASFSNVNITSVMITSSTQKEFYSKIKPNYQRSIDYNYTLVEKIYYNDREIGKIKIDYNLGQVHHHLKKQVMNLIFIRFLQIVLALLVILYLLHYIFIKRIEMLILQARCLVKKDFEKPFIWDHGDPINELGRDLEHARSSLKDLFHEVSQKNIALKEINKNLENLVVEKSLEVVQSARMAALGEMAASIAHEINNPLAVISGRAQLIEKNLTDINRKISNEELIESALKINKMSQRIAKIVKSLKFFSRNSDNDELVKVYIPQIFEDTLDLCYERIKDFEVSFKLSDVPQIYIEAKSVQLSQVLLNLINNALDAVKGFNERWINIDITEEENLLRIRITDSGKGIPEDVAAKMMLPFYTTKGPGEGTGLGLSISVGIINNHNGKLYLDSECENTSFVIELPKQGIL